MATYLSNLTSPIHLCTLFHTSGDGQRSGFSVTGAGSAALCLKPAFQKQFCMVGVEVSLQDAAIIFVAATISRDFRREFPSLIYILNTNEVSLSKFFLYLLL